MNRVFLLGGADDINFDVLSNQVLEWNVINHSLTKKAPIPIKRVDFGACFSNGLIYCVKGYADTSTFIVCDDTNVYDVRNDEWHTLPNLSLQSIKGIRC